MSIFKETFQKFVYNQLKIREAALNQNSGRILGRPKVKDFIGEAPTLDAGAFYTNTTSRQCVIRMSSGADLKAENTLIDENDVDKNNLVNEGLAIRYILEGGVPTKNADIYGTTDPLTVKDSKGNKTTIRMDKPLNTRGKLQNFDKGGDNNTRYGSSYGDPWIRSDAKDDFGIVPMPGIIDAEIRTKTAYGSLRDAKINFVCHNRRQLDVLDTLYMRPGMPILLEWGWDPYISNLGKRESYFPYLWEWFDQDSSVNNINEEIRERIKNSGGNYDGFVGYVKNFEITSRPDGGYDCTTELAAMGEVLEGLKGRNDGFTIKMKDGDDDIEVDNFEFMLSMLQEWAEVEKLFAQGYGKPGKVLGYEKGNKKTKRLLKFLELLNNIILPELGEKRDKVNYSSEISLSDLKILSFETDFGDKVDNLKYISKFLDKYILYKDEALGVEGNEERNNKENIVGNNTRSTQHYVKWELLVAILNKLVIDTYQEGTTTSPITEISFKDEVNSSILKYSKYNFKNGQTVKVNPREDDPTTITVNLSDLMDMSTDPTKCLLPHQIDKITTKSDGSIIDYFFGDSIREIEEGSNKRNISDIFISLDYLLKLYRRTRYKGDEINEDFNLFTFLQTVWEKDINNACANTHNFTIHTEKTRGNVVRVIDMQQDNLNPQNFKHPLYKFKTHGKESIVRDFNYNTTIDSKLSSTVAIAAQSPNSIGDLDAVSFAAFNRNIKYRFFKEDISDTSFDSNIKKKADKYDKDLASLKEMLVFLYNYRIKILRGEFDDDEIAIAKAKSYIKSVESKIISLKSRYSKDVTNNKGPFKGFRKPVNNVSKTTVIPLKFNCQIDGIGGIVIGNIFKIESKFLPKGYDQEDIAFAVMTENQKITAGQDWTTDFSGQFLLLDLPNNEPEEDIDLNSL